MRAWNVLSVLLIGLLSVGGRAQSIQWASRVIGVSSEKVVEPSGKRRSPFGEQYKASQALGSPSKLPSLGESPCAWAPQQADGQADEWIQVGFAKPLQAQQIVVAENVNPGAVIRILAFDENGVEHLVYQAPGIQERTDPLLRVSPRSRVFYAPSSR